MSDNKQYIIIDNKMTLNVWKDATSDTRQEGEFQILKNYIPDKGGLIVRKGITVFSYV